MIQVVYKGRLGNNLFQYCLGRILAEELGVELIADPIGGFPRTADAVDGERFDDDEWVLKRHRVPLDKILQERPKRKIRVWGQFQRYEVFAPYADRIRQWLAPAPSVVPKTLPGPDDLVIGIRRTDYVVENSLLPFSFYADIAARYRKVWVLTDDPDDPFVTRFCDDTGAALFHESMLRDFNFMRHANHICMSQSTFHWWAAYLSSAEKVYFPLPKTGLWSGQHHDIDLKIDEPRFEYVAVNDDYVHTDAEWAHLRRYHGRVQARAAQLAGQKG